MMILILHHHDIVDTTLILRYDTDTPANKQLGFLKSFMVPLVDYKPLVYY